MKKIILLFFLTHAWYYIHAQEKQTIDNLKTFAKAYGYVKYFHPSTEGAQLNWSKFAVYGAEEIVKCNNQEEVITTLNNLFQPLAPTVYFYSSQLKFESWKSIFPNNLSKYKLTYWQHIGVNTGMNKPSRTYRSIRVGIDGKKLFDQEVKEQDCIEKEIGHNIFCHIPMTLYYRNKKTYPESNPEKWALLKNNIEICKSEPTDLSLRLGNIINAYNVFQHFFPYFQVIEVNWEHELEKALKRSFTDNNGYDHFITLQKFTSPLNDGHLLILSDHLKTYVPPIKWEWLENKLIITGVYDSTLTINKGDIITHINGESTIDYFKEVYSRVSAGTNGFLNLRAMGYSQFGEKDSELNVTVNGKVITMKRNRDLWKEGRGIKVEQEAYKIIEDSIYYLNLDVISMKEIQALMPSLEKCKAIVCDLRGYPNGNHDLIAHLLKIDDTTKTWMQVPQVIYPDQERPTGYENHEWLMKRKKPHLGDKKIIFLTGGGAISYAESYMAYIEGYNLATIIGQPTAGTNGNVNSFNLAGGYAVRWTGMKVVKHDGSQLYGIGITPDIYVNRTIEGVIQGKDEFLEKAIDILKK